MTFEERLAALESQAAANQLPASFAALQRKLEQSWQPDASVLLQAGSVIGSMLGGIVDTDGMGLTFGTTRVRWGIQNVSFAAAVASSATVTHLLGKTTAPTFVGAVAASGSSALVNATVGTVGATTFVIGARYVDAVARTGTEPVYWLAIG